MRYIRYGQVGKPKEFFPIFEVTISDLNAYEEPLRCPHCGKKQIDTEIIAGWCQYGFYGDRDAHDVYVVLGACNECNKSYALKANVPHSK